MKIVYTADWHLDPIKTPVCRLDDFKETQIRKIKFIEDFANEHEAMLLHGGDVVDRDNMKGGREALAFYRFLFSHLPVMWGIIGNHDLYMNTMDQLKMSMVSTMIDNNRYNVIEDSIEMEDCRIFGYNHGSEIAEVPVNDKVNIAVYHGFVDTKKNTLIEGHSARDLLNEFGHCYDFILTGDHHKPFVMERNGCTLINAGSIMRTTIKQVDHKPCVWLIDTETKEYEQIFIPIEDASEVITTAHADMEKDRDERIEAFVTYAGNEYEVTNSFEDNMKSYLKEHNEVDTINGNVVKYINNSMEGIA